MNIPKVSVIIPVYNTEEYIGETLNSIINQTLKEIEIIVINDGSTDNSLQIINEYARIDNRIIVYSQENQGLSLTRNKGIKEASAEYIYFMDSDDLLDKDALDSCYKQSSDLHLDFLFFDAEVICSNNTLSSNIKYYRTHLITEKKVFRGLDILLNQIQTNSFSSSVCLYFINRSFIEKYNLKFFPHIIHEDQLFTFSLYVLAEKVYCIPKPYFKRRVREDSIMTKKFSLKNMNGYFTVSREILKYRSGGSDKLKKTIDLFLFQMLNATSYGASTLAFNERMSVLGELIFKYFKYMSIKSLARILFKRLFNKYKPCQ